MVGRGSAEDHIKEAQSSFEDIKNYLRKFTDLESRTLKDLHSLIDDGYSNLDYAYDEVYDLEGKLKTLEEELDYKKEIIEGIEGEVYDLQDKVEELESKIEEYERILNY